MRIITIFVGIHISITCIASEQRFMVWD